MCLPCCFVVKDVGGVEGDAVVLKMRRGNQISYDPLSENGKVRFNALIPVNLSPANLCQAKYSPMSGNEDNRNLSASPLSVS